MKRNFDFVIKEDDGYSKIVLRFYPKKSRVFTFDDTQPSSWDDVYVNYTSYSILVYSTFKTTYVTPSNAPYKPFVVDIDESEALLELRQALFAIINGKKAESYNIHPVCCGIDWEIMTKNNNNTYVFTMIKNFSGEAFRFELPKEKLTAFYNILNEYLEYILKYRLGS